MFLMKSGKDVDRVKRYKLGKLYHRLFFYMTVLNQLYYYISGVYFCTGIIYIRNNRYINIDQSECKRTHACSLNVFWGIDSSRLG